MSPPPPSPSSPRLHGVMSGFFAFCFSHEVGMLVAVFTEPKTALPSYI